MIHFFQTSERHIYAVQSANTLADGDIQKLTWLFSGAQLLPETSLQGTFTGPRREMITPWSTNAVEITQNMGIGGITRIEEYAPAAADAAFDPMLQRRYDGLGQDLFTIDKQPDPILHIDDIAAYNEQEGLALSREEIDYLNGVSQKLGRKLTDSEVFGFSQVNSEHCRHKIFGGKFVIDGEEKPESLFALIKKTSATNPNKLVSAYKDNVAFNEGPVIEQFAPRRGDTSDFFRTKPIESVISLKAETHNFPTTVEPFNGAATGTGGEIRDRLGGGKASLPIAGTAVYMTSYPRPEASPSPSEGGDVSNQGNPEASPLGGGMEGARIWEQHTTPRPWLYQTPEQILIKASNGASDFGNKFGQPLICGSLLTFEHEENGKTYGYDKVIMLAGGVGFAKKADALKGTPEPHEKVVVMGGDNYRIGMGGGAVSSVDTGQYANAIELNAVQRANPEMQKRVANVIRTLAESDDNPIVSIHDHGAGGHLNCLSELVETTGGRIDMSQLPIGDPTLSAKEIIGNESQERMGFLLREQDVERVRRLAERERAPMYVVGETTGDMQFVFTCPPTPQRGDSQTTPGYHTSNKANYHLLAEHAKDMKRFSTEAESCLWEMLRKKNLGDKFRRQHVIDDFIVDFVCLPKKLVIEVDGQYHNEPEMVEADKQRTEVLESLGYRVLRFTNEEVLANTDAVLQTIQTELTQTPPPSEGLGEAINMQLSDFFGNPPRTVITDHTVPEHFAAVQPDEEKLLDYLRQVLQVESVACKDWLTNKVDRSVTGKIARQQCVGEIQLPLADLGAVALDYRGRSGIATSIGHAPLVALADPAAGSVMAVAEALTNIVWAPLADGLRSVSLSANWMWPCKNPGEDARLYQAVEACSDFACALGINIPTGKDSLSMTQKYGEKKVFSPGTVIISAGAEVADVTRIVTPDLKDVPDSYIYYIDFSFDAHKLGGSVLAQVLGRIGDEVPTVRDAEYFAEAFNALQELIGKGLVLAGHDISEGGLITALLEMCFPNTKGGLHVKLDDLAEHSLLHILFAENPGVLIQVKNHKAVERILMEHEIGFARIAQPIAERRLEVHKKKTAYAFAIDELRDLWYRSSYLLDRRQSGEQCAAARYANYKEQPLEFKYADTFRGKLSQFGLSPDRQPSGVRAAIIREQGTNGEREMAYALYLAGFDVKDVHMTDLVSGRETLDDVNMIVFCGGFANSDVLGSAKGWAGSFLYNEKAKAALDRFYARPDTLSLGICNGCQLMVELGLVTPDHDVKPCMLHNDSHKFESEFVTLAIPDNHSVMFGSLAGNKLGIWVAHGEGKFRLPKEESAYHIVAKYNHSGYPANPNGSDYDVAGLCSADGRHLAMMPHLERAIFPWQCAHYPADRRNSDQITPWAEAFVNARRWVERNR